MTLLQTTTLAQTQARQNLSVNLAALKKTQPRLEPWIIEQLLEVEWIFARDRTLTALEQDGQWWSGCSLPKRAAEAVLSKLDVKGAVGCFLAPSHSALLKTAMEKLRPEQAIVAIVPKLRDLALMLHCEDFSADITSHRLWFAAGPGWDVTLRDLLDEQSGLATPTSFIRTPDADASVIEPIITAAQRIFSDINARRTTAIQAIRQNHRGDRSRVCVVVPSRFRLWNDLGPAMLGAFDGLEDFHPIHFDADDPCNSSPLALVSAASACGIILTSNTARTDLPGLVPETVPWITWVTCPRIPSPALAGADDHLIVVDPKLKELALRSGWVESRVHVGTWPKAHGWQSVGPATQGARSISIIADTCDLETPKDLIEYSSHSLLWEAIRNELLADPFVLRDINLYVNNRMRQLGVGEDNFPRARFIEKLIVPAYQQGVAHTLLKAGVPLTLHGRGWDTLDEFKSIARGPIESREQLEAAVKSSAALVHVWPTNLAHPIDIMGAPVVRSDQGARALLDQAHRAMRGQQAALDVSKDLLCPNLLERILRPLAA